MTAIVLGAGVAGVMTAYFLARGGQQVMVVDRRDGAAMETSFANGGVVGGTQVEPWAQPGLPLKVLRWLGKEDAPLLVRYGQIPHMWGWGLRFLRNCTEARFHRNMATSLRLTLYGLELFEQVRADNAIADGDYDLRRHGALKVYLTQQDMDAAAREAVELESLGMPCQAIDRETCTSLEPGLGPVADTLIGGLHFPREEVGDCHKFARVMSQRCRDLGVDFRWHTAVEGLEVAGGRISAVATDQGSLSAESVVVAMASYTAPLLRRVGVRVPVCPLKGVTVTVPVAGWDDAVRTAVMDHSRLFGLIRLGDRLRVSGSAEITGYEIAPDPHRCQALVDNVLELFPAFASCVEAAEPVRWAGVRGNSPDGPPILGPTSIANLFLNVGHGPQGWSTSCASAKLVADLVCGGEPEIDLDGLTLARF